MSTHDRPSTPQVVAPAPGTAITSPQVVVPASGTAITSKADVKKVRDELSSDLREIQISSRSINSVIEGALKWSANLGIPEQIQFLNKLRVYLNYLMLLTPETREGLGVHFVEKTLGCDPFMCFDLIEQEILSIGDNKKMDAICRGKS